MELHQKAMQVWQFLGAEGRRMYLNPDMLEDSEINEICNKAWDELGADEMRHIIHMFSYCQQDHDRYAQQPEWKQFFNTAFNGNFF